MKPLSEQDHYEVLEVPRGASSEELRRAYQLAATTYREDSMAGYSIYVYHVECDEANEVRKQLGMPELECEDE